jgi:hypothetical protein
MWLQRTERIGAWKFWVRILKGVSLLGKRMISWEDDINGNLEETEWLSRTVLIWLTIGKSGEMFLYK